MSTSQLLIDMRFKDNTLKNYVNNTVLESADSGTYLTIDSQENISVLYAESGSQGLKIPYETKYDPNNGDYFCIFRFKILPSTLTSGACIIGGDGNPTFNITIYPSYINLFRNFSDNFYMYFSSGSWPNDNKYHIYTLYRKDGNSYFYLDNVLQDSKTDTRSLSFSGQSNFYIGGFGGGRGIDHSMTGYLYKLKFGLGDLLPDINIVFDNFKVGD